MLRLSKTHCSGLSTKAVKGGDEGSITSLSYHMWTLTMGAAVSLPMPAKKGSRFSSGGRTEGSVWKGRAERYTSPRTVSPEARRTPPMERPRDPETSTSVTRLPSMRRPPRAAMYSSAAFPIRSDRPTRAYPTLAPFLLLITPSWYIIIPMEALTSPTWSFSVGRTIRSQKFSMARSVWPLAFSHWRKLWSSSSGLCRLEKRILSRA